MNVQGRKNDGQLWGGMRDFHVREKEYPACAESTKNVWHLQILSKCWNTLKRNKENFFLRSQRIKNKTVNEETEHEVTPNWVTKYK